MIVLLVNLGIIYGLSLRIQQGNNITVFHGLSIGFVGLGLVLLFTSIRVGQVVEVNATNFATYYHAGRYKIKDQSFSRPAKVTLHQDRDRYYCLRIETSDGKRLALERYPTLREGNERLNELTILFG